MESLKLIATLLPLSLTAGINLYATVGMVGLCEKFGWIKGMPAGLDIFDNWWLITLAFVLYIIEFVVDKFEFFDNAWDVLSTFIRPLGAFAMGSAALGSMDPSVSISGALICSAVALQSHVSKAGSRVALNVVSPGETVSNSIISLLEDIFVFAVVWFALTYPYVTAVVTAIILGIMIVTAPRLFRWTFFFIKSIFALFGSWFHSKESYDTVPAALMELLGHADTKAALECKCSGISGIRGRNGYLAIVEDKIVFLYHRYLMSNKWEYKIADIKKAYFRKKFFLDLLEIPYKNERGKNKIAHFAFLKTSRDMAEKFTDMLNSIIDNEPEKE